MRACRSPTRTSRAGLVGAIVSRRDRRFAMSAYLRCRIFARIRRFLRPIFRRPLPVFLVPMLPIYSKRLTKFEPGRIPVVLESNKLAFPKVGDFLQTEIRPSGHVTGRGGEQPPLTLPRTFGGVAVDRTSRANWARTNRARPKLLGTIACRRPGGGNLNRTPMGPLFSGCTGFCVDVAESVEKPCLR